MVDRDALRSLATALPADAPMTLPAGWLLELLSGFGAPAVPTQAPEVDLTPEEAGAALQRSPVTIRAFCRANLFFRAPTDSGVASGAFRGRPCRLSK